MSLSQAPLSNGLLSEFEAQSKPVVFLPNGESYQGSKPLSSLNGYDDQASSFSGTDTSLMPNPISLLIQEYSALFS